MWYRGQEKALNNGLRLKKVQWLIQFKPKAWLKVYIDMNTQLRKVLRMNLNKKFFKLWNNFVFEKTKVNVRKHRDIKLATPEKRRERLVLEPNYHSCKKFSDHLMAKEIKKNKSKNK